MSPIRDPDETETRLSAVEPVEASAGRGDPEAQLLLACWYASGEHGLPRDEDKRVYWLEQAAAQGVVEARGLLGMVYVTQESTQLERGLELVEDSARRGHSESQVYLGILYKYGDHRPKDPKLALTWFQRAADQGNCDARFHLGELLCDGEGVAQDKKRGLSWIRQAAEADSASAALELGYRYRDGRDVPRDTVQSVQWFRRAAELDDEEAQYCLAVALWNGEGIDQDEERALYWMRRSAEEGDEDAREFLNEQERPATTPNRPRADRAAWLRRRRIRRALVVPGTGILLAWFWHEPLQLAPLLIVLGVVLLALVSWVSAWLWTNRHPDTVTEGDVEQLRSELPARRRFAVQQLVELPGRYGVFLAPWLLAQSWEPALAESVLFRAVAALWAGVSSALWMYFLQHNGPRLLPSSVAFVLYASLVVLSPWLGLANLLAFGVVVRVASLMFTFYVRRALNEEA